MSQAKDLVGMTQQDRIELLEDAATAIWRLDRVRVQVCVAQAILESRILSTPSKLATQCNNLFGIKGKGTAGSVKMTTWEVMDGDKVEVLEFFSKNETLEDSFQQHFNLLHRPRYARVLEAPDYIAASRALVSCGYATDPEYAVKLITIIGKYIDV